MIALSLVLAGLMGITLGLLGAGGSILTVPILRYVVGFDPKQAIALSLGVVGVTSLIGALRYGRAGHARPGVAIPFGLISMAGSYGGAKIAEHIAGQAQLLIFSLLMLAAGGSMIREQNGPQADRPDARRGSGWASLLMIAALGLAVGLLTGLVGIGGGFMILPALVVLVKLPMRDAAGTSLAIMAMNAAAGLMGYTAHVEIPWMFLLGFTTAAVAGIIVGTYLAPQVSPVKLRRAFALFVIVMGLMILYGSRSALAGRDAFRAGEAPGPPRSAPAAGDAREGIPPVAAGLPPAGDFGRHRPR
jgi:uncharacterized membrane protein YfcA